MSNNRRQGGCLCGKVRFEVTVNDPHYAVCHCSICRKWSGGPLMCVHAPGDDVSWIEKSGLKWYRSSDWAERGFCSDCGSSLFYRLAQQPEAMLIVSIDSLDDADGISIGQHIFIDAKPDRYDFADNAPRLTEAEFMAAMSSN